MYSRKITLLLLVGLLGVVLGDVGKLIIDSIVPDAGPLSGNFRRDVRTDQGAGTRRSFQRQGARVSTT
jgi:hypothetical protein